MPQDSYSESQGKLILARQWASQEQVSYAWQALAARPQFDLCAALVQMGQLNMAQAVEIRSSIGQASEQTVLGQHSAPQPRAAPSLPPENKNESTVLGQLGSQRSSQERVPHLSQSSSGEFNISIPGYEFVKEIGRGGMGAVFLVNQEGSQTACVAKVMLNAEMDEDAYLRFKREAQAMAKLKHENIVAIKTFGEINGYPYFIMEHIVGRELKEHIEEHVAKTGSAPPIDVVLEWLIPVARGLTYAHKKGIVHRDLKPANILVEAESQRAVILDYGLAKTENQDLSESLSNGENLTKTGQALGTPAYMAPEQLDLSSQSGVQPANDVWGFAATLFFALTGQAPYVGPTPINIYNQLLKNSPPVLSDLNPRIPRWLVQLCELCFQRDMEQRPTMAAVLKALETQDSSGLNLNLTRAAKKKRTRKIALTIASFIVFIVSSAILYIYLTPDKAPLQAEFVGRVPSQSVETTLTLEVKSNYDPGKVQVSGTLFRNNKALLNINFVPKDGIFQGVFDDLEDGAHSVEILVRSKAEQGPEQKIEIKHSLLIDHTPPKISRLSMTADGWLSGEISEDNCTVQWNQKTIKSKNRRFRIQLDPLTFTSRDSLVVTDLVGHKAKPKTLPYHVVRKGGALTLVKAIKRASANDVIFIHPGRYSTSMTVDKPLSLIGLISKETLDKILTLKELPLESVWPIIEGFEKPAFSVRLKEKGQVVLRGVAFNQKNFDPNISEKMAEDTLSKAELDDKRTEEQKKEKKDIRKGLLTLKMSEDEVFAPDSRAQQSPIIIHSGRLILDHCLVQSEAFVLLLCGPERYMKTAQPGLIARQSVFLRKSVLGAVVLGSKAELEQCTFIEKRSPTGDYTRRKAERPFIFKYPALFGIWNRGEASIRNCRFLNSLDRSIFAGQKKGYFPSVIAQITLEDSLISVAKSDGLYMGWTVDAKVKNCTFENAVENGVYLNGANVTLTMENSRVRRCGFGESGKNEEVPGLLSNGSVKESKITNCQIEDCGGAGLGLLGPGRFIVERSRFLRNGAGIFMGGSFSGTLKVSESDIFDNKIAAIHMLQAAPTATASFTKSQVRSPREASVLYVGHRFVVFLGHSFLCPRFATLILDEETLGTLSSKK